MARLSWSDLLRLASSLISSEVSEEVRLQSDLNEHLGKLRTALQPAYLLIDQAEWWRFDRETVADLLKQLKHAIYEASDLLEEFDYRELRHEVEGSGTSRARRLLAPASNFGMHFVECTAKRAVEAHERLNHVSTQLKSSIELLGLHKGPKQEDKSMRPETSSIISEPEIYGRVEEKESLINLLLRSYDRDEAEGDMVIGNKRRKRDNLSVLPIVGIGGVGKTTLARLVYNSPRVQEHFHLKIWICVSDHFDSIRLTKEIMGPANMGNESQYADLDLYQVKMKRMLSRRHMESQYVFNNLNSLQERLKGILSSKRFLIVLDDVWNDNRGDWENLFAPLRYGLEGSMILVTTRSMNVSDATGTMDPFLLNGLPEDTYWRFFKACVFGTHGYHIAARDAHLEKIGKSIAGKLNGSPLAAKSIGSLLKIGLNVSHWRSILNSKLWELKEEANGILPALRLSYQYLPLQLKQCFSFCAMFPKDFLFQKNRLVDMWVSAGFIMPQGNELLEEIGTRYFEELVMRFFFQKEPKFNVDYLIPDLMHDLAQSVSQDECFCIKNGGFKREISHYIRHLSVDFDHGDLNELGGYEKLHSLSFLKQTKGFSIGFLFDKLTCLRMLKLSCCDITEIPESIEGLKHLCYLDVSRLNIKTLPRSLCFLYKLEILDIRECPLEYLPRGFSNLIKLRKVYSLRAISNMVPEIGRLTSLQNLQDFFVLNEQGHGIGQLKDMSRIHGSLNIRNLENVESRNDAMRANLCDKKYLRKLTLEWSPDRTTEILRDEEILEGLEPHPDVNELVIRGFRGCKPPSWLNSRVLPDLVVLRYKNCPTLMEITNFPSFLTKLDIIRCPNLARFQIPSYLPNIKTIYISSCERLTSIPVENFGTFDSLECLEIVNCPNLKCSAKLVLPRSIKRCVLNSCGDLDRSLPDCLRENLNLLATLELYNCPRIKAIPDHVLSSLKALHVLAISNCEELEVLGGFHELSSLKYLSIERCPKFVASKSFRPFYELRGNGIRLDCVTIDDTSLLELLALRNSLCSLRELKIQNSLESVMFGGDGSKLSENLRSVRVLWFNNCPNLSAVPTQLKLMTCLESLSFTGCSRIKPVRRNCLPTSLTSVIVSSKERLISNKKSRHLIHVRIFNGI